MHGKIPMHGHSQRRSFRGKPLSRRLKRALKWRHSGVLRSSFLPSWCLEPFLPGKWRKRKYSVKGAYSTVYCWNKAQWKCPATQLVNLCNVQWLTIISDSDLMSCPQLDARETKGLEARKVKRTKLSSCRSLPAQNQLSSVPLGNGWMRGWK